MCGIAGFLSAEADRSQEECIGLARAMARTLAHRGPDDEGAWGDARAAVALGHTRLSIVDLSERGRQPMCSQSGRYVIAYNGEVYNFRDLSRELQTLGHRFAGHSDTEVLLGALEHWGLHGALKRVNGMFAFAVWDAHHRQLHLVRDRLGEKPLYFGRAGADFIFGSELKALRVHPSFRPEIDRSALKDFLQWGYVPAPGSIYTGIQKVLPGQIVTVTSASSLLASERYWSLPGTTYEATDRDDSLDQLHDLLAEAVAMRTFADVPVGAFLSGGIDSSLVVALMQLGRSQPVHTFSIGFTDASYDEAQHAKAVAGHLGTHHTEFYVSGTDALDLVPSLSSVYDEPFADSSQLPTMLIAALARKHVTVVLTGDGGDEVFGGYERYDRLPRAWRMLRPIPLRAREIGSKALATPSARSWWWIERSMRGAGLPAPSVAERIGKVAQLMPATGPQDIYHRSMARLTRPGDLLADFGSADESALPDHGAIWPLRLPVEGMFAADLTTYMPDDILVKVDRASMAVGLECRVPLLDHRVVEYAWALPASAKIRDGRGKLPLREMLDRYVPRGLIDRPKQGFNVPIRAWLRGPLREWASDHLTTDRILRDGYLAPSPIHRMWREHVAGHRDWQYQLWSILIFQAWLADQ